MSRREDEFVRRTTIFEGAFRAWSFLGAQDPVVLESKAAKEFDPSAFGEENFHYEPLPRSGLQHPYVKAILSPWIGSNANQEAVELGLGTLRTWWQHRRKGPNKTAERTLKLEKNRQVVGTYMKHFFELAHCLVVSDKVQPPRSLQLKMRTIEKSSAHGPLSGPLVNVKNKCLPGEVDLPGMMKHINASVYVSNPPESTPVSMPSPAFCGDPDTTPTVFVNARGDAHLVLTVGGITCAHCVKIVETVLRGCPGSQSPIDGLLDAAADRDLFCVLIKISKPSEAKRIAFEAARNLSLVGYKAKPRELPLSWFGSHEAAAHVFQSFSSYFPSNRDAFDWSAPCSCPDNGVYREHCRRHSQMSHNNVNGFAAYEHRIMEFAKTGYTRPAASDPHDDFMEVIDRISDVGPQASAEAGFSAEPLPYTRMKTESCDPAEQNDDATEVGNLDDLLMELEETDPTVHIPKPIVVHRNVRDEPMSGLSILSVDWESFPGQTTNDRDEGKSFTDYGFSSAVMSPPVYTVSETSTSSCSFPETGTVIHQA